MKLRKRKNVTPEQGRVLHDVSSQTLYQMTVDQEKPKRKKITIISKNEKSNFQLPKNYEVSSLKGLRFFYFFVDCILFRNNSLNCLIQFGLLSRLM